MPIIDPAPALFSTTTGCPSRLAETFRNDAAGGVGAGAGRERHDELDRPVRIILRERGQDHRRDHQHQRQRQQFLHARPPASWRWHAITLQAFDWTLRASHSTCRLTSSDVIIRSQVAPGSHSLSTASRTQDLRDGLVAVVKRDCPTCVMVEPVLRQLAAADAPLTVLTQDDPAFPSGVPGVVDDTGLERSFALGIETVPTTLRIEHGRETTRAVGWHRGEWESLTGMRSLGPDLPEQRPGCGSLTADPNIADELAIRLGGVTFASRKSRSAATRTSTRPASTATGPTACRWCRRRPCACIACCRGPSATPRRCWAACLPTTSPARWRRWRSTRSWRAASRSTCRWSSPRWKQRSTRRSASTPSSRRPCSSDRSSS